MRLITPKPRREVGIVDWGQCISTGTFGDDDDMMIMMMMMTNMMMRSIMLFGHFCAILYGHC